MTDYEEDDHNEEYDSEDDVVVDEPRPMGTDDEYDGDELYEDEDWRNEELPQDVDEAIETMPHGENHAR